MVLELSSFQLDDIKNFRPDIAVLLNISADHLDRYDYDIMKYASAKMRITENQNADDHFIYNGDDSIILKLNATNAVVSEMHPIKESQYIDGIISKESAKMFDIGINGKHNLFNARCAVEVARLLGVSESDISRGLSTFVNEPHRFETVGIVNGVKFINDSKATNVDAVTYALDAIDGDIIWIAGGTDKGNDYEPLQQIARQKVKAMICLGVDNMKIVQSFAESIPLIVESTEVSSVVDIALDLAEEGDTVILSPACASFDLFKNYKDRGDQFREAVAQRDVDS